MHPKIGHNERGCIFNGKAKEQTKNIRHNLRYLLYNKILGTHLLYGRKTRKEYDE